MDTHGRVIELAPWPTHIDGDGQIHFRHSERPEAQRLKGRTRVPDVLIMATGYDLSFPFFDDSYPRPDQADFRRIWKSGEEDVGFIGFVRPAFGKCTTWNCGALCVRAPLSV